MSELAEVRALLKEDKVLAAAAVDEEEVGEQGKGVRIESSLLALCACVCVCVCVFAQQLAPHTAMYVSSYCSSYWCICVHTAISRWGRVRAAERLDRVERD